MGLKTSNTQNTRNSLQEHGVAFHPCTIPTVRSWGWVARRLPCGLTAGHSIKQGFLASCNFSSQSKEASTKAPCHISGRPGWLCCPEEGQFKSGTGNVRSTAAQSLSSAATQYRRWKSACAPSGRSLRARSWRLSCSEIRLLHAMRCVPLTQYRTHRVPFSMI